MWQGVGGLQAHAEPHPTPNTNICVKCSQNASHVSNSRLPPILHHYTHYRKCSLGDAFLKHVDKLGNIVLSFPSNM